MARAPARPTAYALAFPQEVERRFLRFRASIRAAIRRRLEDIVAAAGKSRANAKMLAGKEPPLRFYVYEGFRVAYQVDPGTRRVVVLDIAAVTS
jgi:mRNA-degrading endonuclease RelE of RelBE toxin-antitoxin system